MPPDDDPAFDPGIPGGSSRRKHERLVAKRDAETRDRWGRRLGGVVLALTDEPQSSRAWAIGTQGEEKLAKALAGFSVLHDRRVPGDRRNIDHIVIAAPGVFVVDAKNYRGRIEIRDKGGLFRTDSRLYVRGRDRSDDVDHMGWQVAAVERALAGTVTVTPVLCFIDGEFPVLFPPKEFGGVRLESERSMRGLLAAPGPLGSDDIGRITRTLAEALPPR